jgi:hypothetical protein
MKTVLTLAAVALLALPCALLGQEPPAQPAEPAPTAAPEAPAPAPAPQATPPPAASTPPRVLYDKVNIVVDGKAEYAGNIQITVEPDGRTAKLVSVNVLAKEKEKKIAEQIHREVSIALGADYKVKLSGNEIRVSKANKKFPNVAIVIHQLQLPGVSVRVERG